MNKQTQRILEDERERIAEIMEATIRSDIAQKKEFAEKIKQGIEKLGRKRFIHDCVVSYRAYYNDEYTRFLEYVRDKKRKMPNKFAADSSGELRNVFDIPERLARCINQFMSPEFPENQKEMEWFFRSFPEFNTAEKF